MEIRSIPIENYNEETLGNYLKDLGVTDNLDLSLDHVNKEEDTLDVLSKKLEEDIKQYLSDIAEIWGNDAVVVKIEDDESYAVWKDHWMPTIDFYKFVFKNNGIVRPEDFEGYGENKKSHRE